MTTFKSALALCGLTQTEAAECFSVSLQTVKHWSSGRNRPPEGVWDMLSDLFERVQDAADYAADHMAIDGIDPRAFGEIEADTGTDPLPGHADRIAGAMALLMSISDHKNSPDR